MRFKQTHHLNGDVGGDRDRDRDGDERRETTTPTRRSCWIMTRRRRKLHLKRRKLLNTSYSNRAWNYGNASSSATTKISQALQSHLTRLVVV
ncbi:hypothetical protein AKJ16_DCAP21559 [Drosera capensis]